MVSNLPFIINLLAVFHTKQESITFQRENNTYFAVCKDEKKPLSKTMIALIQKFEKELAQQNDEGCTTIDNYLVIYNNTQRVITDGSCRWKGYEKLKKLLGFTV